MKIILALDNLSHEEIFGCMELRDKVMFKINDAYIRYGSKLIEDIHKLGGDIFLDLKFHDIPNTVANYMKIVADMGVYMCNIHCSGGYIMMKTAADATKKYCEKMKIRRPLIVGVTVLTSLDDTMLQDELKVRMNCIDLVKHYAKIAKDAGLDGVVTSPLEIEVVKEICGKDFLIITPGIRPLWAGSNDQHRIMTPKGAVEKGCDYLVIGRPIISSELYGITRNEAIDRIYEEIKIS